MYGKFTLFYESLKHWGYLCACASSVYQASPQGGGAWGQGNMQDATFSFTGACPGQYSICTFWLVCFRSSVISLPFNNFHLGLVYCMEIMVLLVPLTCPRIMILYIIIYLKNHNWTSVGLAHACPNYPWPHGVCACTVRMCGDSLQYWYWHWNVEYHQLLYTKWYEHLLSSLSSVVWGVCETAPAAENALMLNHSSVQHQADIHTPVCCVHSYSLYG